MSYFNAQIEVSDGTTIVTTEGMLSVDELVKISVSGWYGLTTQVIWDLRRTDLDDMTRTEYERMSRGFAARQDKRRTKAAVIVLKDRYDLIEMRFYTLIGAHKVGQTVQQFLTTDMGEAHAWLESVRTDQDQWVPGEDDVPVVIRD